jgi:Transglycosylase SLT domain
VADPMTVGDAIEAAARQYGLNPAVLKGIARIESSWDPTSNYNKTTQYKGLFQLGGEEWKQHGSGNIYNAQDNANAAGSLLRSHSNWFQKNYGREPTPSELYMMHQQGRGFFTKGTMTNIANNAYPGMSGPQTPQSFHQGWAARLERAMAPYGGGDSIAGAPATAPDIWNPANAEKVAAAAGPIPNMPDASTLPPGMAQMVNSAVPVANGVPPPGAAAPTVTASAAPTTEAAQAAVDKAKAKGLDAEKNDEASKGMMKIAQALMAMGTKGPDFKPLQLNQVDTGPFRPLPLNFNQLS